jgi:hypothetical protein
MAFGSTSVARAKTYLVQRRIVPVLRIEVSTKNAFVNLGNIVHFNELCPVGPQHKGHRLECSYIELN